MANSMEKRVISIESSLKWHKMLILALYGLLGLFLLSLLSKVTITGFSVINVNEVNSMNWEPLLIVGAALVRSLTGWAKASLRDGYLNAIEVRKLGETIVRVGLIGAIVIFLPGSTEFLTFVEVGAIALGGDIVLQAWKKNRSPLAKE